MGSHFLLPSSSPLPSPPPPLFFHICPLAAAYLRAAQRLTALRSSPPLPRCSGGEQQLRRLALLPQCSRRRHCHNNPSCPFSYFARMRRKERKTQRKRRKKKNQLKTRRMTTTTISASLHSLNPSQPQQTHQQRCSGTRGAAGPAAPAPREGHNLQCPTEDRRWPNITRAHAEGSVLDNT